MEHAEITVVQSPVTLCGFNFVFVFQLKCKALSLVSRFRGLDKESIVFQLPLERIRNKSVYITV